VVTYHRGGRNETEIEIDDTHNLREIAIFFEEPESIRCRLHSALFLSVSPLRVVSFAPASERGRQGDGKRSGGGGGWRKKEGGE